MTPSKEAKKLIKQAAKEVIDHFLDKTASWPIRYGYHTEEITNQLLGFDVGLLLEKEMARQAKNKKLKLIVRLDDKLPSAVIAKKDRKKKGVSI